MKKYRIKCYYEQYEHLGYSGRLVYMPQVKNLWWWCDLVNSYCIEHIKSKESAMSFIQETKDREAKINTPVTYIEVNDEILNPSETYTELTRMPVGMCSDAECNSFRKRIGLDE